ncbi:MAG: hypothetical protein ACKVOM_02570 [Ferruginibacter sp.]
MKQIFILVLLIICTGAVNTATSQSIKRYAESASNFDKGPELSKTIYPESTMYRAYKKGKTGAASLTRLQAQVENKIREFAKKEGKKFVILGQRTSNPPYVFGNYPRVEIVFALIE